VNASKANLSTAGMVLHSTGRLDAERRVYKQKTNSIYVCIYADVGMYTVYASLSMEIKHRAFLFSALEGLRTQLHTSTSLAPRKDWDTEWREDEMGVGTGINVVPKKNTCMCQ
jgi:glutathionyl-hydroquinone reductase